MKKNRFFLSNKISINGNNLQCKDIKHTCNPTAYCRETKMKKEKDDESSEDQGVPSTKCK